MSPAAINNEIDYDVLAEVVAIFEGNVDSANHICVYLDGSLSDDRGRDEPSGQSPLTCRTGQLIILAMSLQ